MSHITTTGEPSGASAPPALTPAPEGSRRVNLLALRIEHVRDELRRECERVSLLLAEELPAVVRLRSHCAELSECARMVREVER